MAGTPVVAVPEPTFTASQEVLITETVNGMLAPSEAFTLNDPEALPNKPPCGMEYWAPEGPSEMVAVAEMKSVTTTVAFPPELETVIVPRLYPAIKPVGLTVMLTDAPGPGGMDVGGVPAVSQLESEETELICRMPPPEFMIDSDDDMG